MRMMHFRYKKRFFFSAVRGAVQRRRMVARQLTSCDLLNQKTTRVHVIHEIKYAGTLDYHQS
jgi:hypothetical protein